MIQIDANSHEAMRILSHQMDELKIQIEDLKKRLDSVPQIQYVPYYPYPPAYQPWWQGTTCQSGKI